MADPAPFAGDTPDGGAKAPPFGVAFDGDAVVIVLACMLCGHAIVIRANVPTPARVFLKSYLRNNLPTLDGVSIRCDACESGVTDASQH